MHLQRIIRQHGFGGKVSKQSKYRNEKVKVDGLTFDSKAEHRRWCQLNMLQAAGKISDLKRQVPYILAPSVVIDGRKKPALKITVDFTYMEDGVLIVEDTKSPITAEERAFGIRRHLLKHVHGVDLRLTY